MPPDGKCDRVGSRTGQDRIGQVVGKEARQMAGQVTGKG